MDSSRQVEIPEGLLINPRWPLVDRELLAQLPEKFPQKNHTWIASSGSSSENISSVKLIALSREALLTSAAAVNEHLQATSHDIWAQALPGFHVGGLGIDLRAQLSGSRVVAGIQNEKWDAKFFFQTLEKENVTLTALVPTQVYDLIQLGVPAPKSMRAIVVGGSALAEDLYQNAMDLGWPLLPSYGMTECCSQVATATLQGLKIRDRSLHFLSHVQSGLNADGILKVKSKSLLTGFAQWKNGQAIWTDPKSEAWYQTEDRCEIHGSVLTPLGRGIDYIKISGEGVNLLQLQEKLETIARKISPEFWQELAVISKPDPRAENRLILVLTTKVDKTRRDQVTDEFNRQVPPYERLSEHFIVDEIPRTDLGKVSRAKIFMMVVEK